MLKVINSVSINTAISQPLYVNTVIKTNVKKIIIIIKKINLLVGIKLLQLYKNYKLKIHHKSYKKYKNKYDN
jgi:hypothetical protein